MEKEEDKIQFLKKALRETDTPFESDGKVVKVHLTKPLANPDVVKTFDCSLDENEELQRLQRLENLILTEQSMEV